MPSQILLTGHKPTCNHKQATENRPQALPCHHTRERAALFTSLPAELSSPTGVGGGGLPLGLPHGLFSRLRLRPSLDRQRSMPCGRSVDGGKKPPLPTHRLEGDAGPGTVGGSCNRAS